MYREIKKNTGWNTGNYFLKDNYAKIGPVCQYVGRELVSGNVQTVFLMHFPEQVSRGFFYDGTDCNPNG